PEYPEKIDGCPNVSLPDSPLEMTVFLEAILDSKFSQEYPVQKTGEICGVLRHHRCDHWRGVFFFVPR
ncbi:hypothetical protein B0H10DRAFT_2064938, partial [Mycena sp. CBHHK59/15]